VNYRQDANSQTTTTPPRGDASGRSLCLSGHFRTNVGANVSQAANPTEEEQTMNKTTLRLAAAVVFTIAIAMFNGDSTRAFYCYEDEEFCRENGGSFHVNYYDCWTDPMNWFYICSATCTYSWGTNPTQCVVV
jgi:hypothetical protein